MTAKLKTTTLVKEDLPMNKLASWIANGTLSVEELASAPDLIERAKLVKEGLKACNKTLLFPFGVSRMSCYSYTDRAGEYSSWGFVTTSGLFTCFCNWGGDHEIGRVNLANPGEVFLGFENKEFSSDLERFLLEQISKVKEN